MLYIYINNKSSVAIEKSKGGDIKVFIDGSEHKFEEENPNKEEYAHATKRKKYNSFLNNQYENILVLTGAGSSKDIGKDEKKGKILAELWDDAENLLTKPVFDKLCDAINYRDKNANGDFIKNLEKLLSLASIAKDYIISDEVDILKCISKIKVLIKESCTLTLPYNSPHSILLNKITKRKVTYPRFKLFTLNYDTLFEQAGWQSNFTVIDGFSFSIPRIFSGRNFDLDIVSRNKSRVKEEDNFIQKVFHIYKLHGSIDWHLENNLIKQNENTAEALMIYPNQSKYESSYEQPYFEMMSRFQQNLRNENVLLVCIGFSFGDKHIVTAIKEALEQNPSFQLLVINKGIDESNINLKPFIEAAKQHTNIAFIDEIFEDFAKNFPDLQSYNQEDTKKIVINLNSSGNESKSV